MENLLMGFNIVSPVFLVLLLGYFAKQRGHIDDNFVDKGTWIVFYLALPFKLFYDIKNARIESLHPKYVLYILLGVIFVIFLSLIIGKVIGIKDKRKLSAFVHCAYRSNFVYVGFPILDILYNGAPSMEHMIVIVSFGLTLYNISAIILLTYYSESEEKRISFLDIIVKIIKNPMIIGVVFGALFNFLHIPVYSGVDKAIEMVSKISTPMSLILIGASLNFESSKSDFKLMFLSAFIKTVLAPLILIPTGKWLGFTNMELGIAYVFWATPCAANCFIFTRQMNSDYEFASKIITLSFIMSIVTYPVGISLMNYFNLLH
ncbi:MULTISPECIES: AEC family transporter [Peptoniphilus]|jgi:auxin efflux carrier family protein|uniref:AEC family transporter n=1 Tax=Peptoniphilus TaxID=162289 RepID=UPI0002884A53|nr:MULTISPECIES: AEC family transporter [Peptoniphilus]MBS6610670.1 AEC family transporter [Peptoniphilus harei]MDU1954315.1 AEC family transporter [Peptoniphilus lacydonensis]MDU2110612.1 AEC family transporter [Peptoniphilus lacydonensis]MDU2115045.1 AEC family transporter [Peptoniphilus lacydonensis]MDU3750893.1 AEC family transporter [Peptoniphilus rhinitidis]